MQGFALFVLVGCAAAIDFASLGGDAKREATASGLTKITHAVRHRFEDGRFAHLNVEAHVDEAKFSFVDITKMQFTCTDSSVTIRDVSSDFAARVLASSPAVVLTATHAACATGKALFRHVVSAQVAYGVATLVTSQAQYHHVFAHAKVVMRTNALSVLSQEGASAPKVRHHGMKQSSWWNPVDDAESLYNDASNAASDASSVFNAVTSAASTVVDLAEGSYADSQSWALDSGSYNGNVLTNSFSQWDITGNVNVACSASFSLVASLEISISNYNVNSMTIELSGTVTGGATSQISTSSSGSSSGSQQVADIQLAPVTFAIGAVPVVLRPSIPINVGYSANLQVGFNLQVAVQATGSVRVGYSYDGSSWSPILSHSFSWQKAVSNYNFQGSLVITAYAEPSLAVNVDFIGTVMGAVRLIGSASLTGSSSGSANALSGSASAGGSLTLTINAQPVINVQASFQVTIADQTILGPATLGPYTVSGNVYPVYTYTASASTGSTTGSAPAAATGSTTGSAAAPATGSTTGSATGSAPAPATGSTTGSAAAPATGSTAGSATGSAPAPATGSTTGSAAGSAPATGSASGSAQVMVGDAESTAVETMDSMSMSVWYGANQPACAVQRQVSLQYLATTNGVAQFVAVVSTQVVKTATTPAIMSMVIAPVQGTVSDAGAATLSMANTSHLWLVSSTNGVMPLAPVLNIQLSLTTAGLPQIAIVSTDLCDAITLSTVAPANHPDNSPSTPSHFWFSPVYIGGVAALVILMAIVATFGYRRRRVVVAIPAKEVAFV